jgi:CrcB protein
MWNSVLAISLGASLGALLRWGLGLRLNGVFPAVPFGTLAANLVGGYIVGVAMAYFATVPDLAPEWRLFIITGFCGGLTTFSTFSAEVVSLLQQEQWTWALTTIGAHLGGSLLMTLLGIATYMWLQAH